MGVKMSEPMISLKALFDLQDRLASDFGRHVDGASRVVLVWLVDHGQPIKFSQIPAGPQVAPEVQPAPDLNAAAGSLAADQGPDGAEAFLPGADDAPATPVAGGVAPDPVRPGLQPRWTAAEDAKAIRLASAGQKSRDIAAALGRPAEGTRFRLSNVLKPAIDAGRRAAGHRVPLPQGPGAKAEPAPAPPPAKAEPTAAVPDMSRPGWWRAATAALNALGYKAPFDTLVDLALTEGLLKGIKIDMLAADLRIDAPALKNRWRLLVDCVGTHDGNHPTLEEQRHLLDILRHRAGDTSVQAAE